MPVITKYVNCKVWDDGGISYSFKQCAYLREKFNEVPDGEYINVGPSQFAEGGFAMYWRQRLSSAASA